MSADVLDTTVVLYLPNEGVKADAAERRLAAGDVISVQGLNDALVDCRRKAGLSWEETDAFLSGIRQLCRVVDLTPEIHDVGRALAARDRFPVHDAMIVGAALVGDARSYSPRICETGGWWRTRSGSWTANV